MKISQEEIVSAINAYCNAYSPEPTVYPAGMRKAIEAALKVRRARKQAKRDRQRKEKNKQVVESVKPADYRPVSCRFRLQDEGKPYPRSACTACGKTATTGLGNVCTSHPPLAQR